MIPKSTSHNTWSNRGNWQIKRQPTCYAQLGFFFCKVFKSRTASSSGVFCFFTFLDFSAPVLRSSLVRLDEPSSPSCFLSKALPASSFTRPERCTLARWIPNITNWWCPLNLSPTSGNFMLGSWLVYAHLFLVYQRLQPLRGYHSNRFQSLHTYSSLLVNWFLCSLEFYPLGIFQPVPIYSPSFDDDIMLHWFLVYQLVQP